LKKVPQRWVPRFLSPAQKVAQAEASIEMRRILHEVQENYFEVIATGSKSWFRDSNIPIRPQNVCTIADRCHSKDEENCDNDFLHRMQINYARHLTKRTQIQPVIFSGLRFARFEKGKREFPSSDPAGDFWISMDNLISHNGSKGASKFEKHRVSRLPDSHICQTYAVATFGPLEC
jgi:hypothetical protein